MSSISTHQFSLKKSETVKSLEQHNIDQNSSNRKIKPARKLPRAAEEHKMIEEAPKGDDSDDSLTEEDFSKILGGRNRRRVQTAISNGGSHTIRAKPSPQMIKEESNNTDTTPRSINQDTSQDKSSNTEGDGAN